MKMNYKISWKTPNENGELVDISSTVSTKEEVEKIKELVEGDVEVTEVQDNES